LSSTRSLSAHVILRPSIAESCWVRTLLHVDLPGSVWLFFLGFLLKLGYVLSALEVRASLIIELVLLVGELAYSNSVVSTQTRLWTLWILRKCWSSRSGLLAGDGFGSLRHMSRSLARIL
jgi:hypothetical protein